MSDINACQRQADAHDLRSRSPLPSCSGLVKIFPAPSRTKNWQKGARWRVMRSGTSHACMQASSTSRSQEARQMSKWAQARLCFAVQRKPHSSEPHSAEQLKTALPCRITPAVIISQAAPERIDRLPDRPRALLPQTSGPRRLRRQPLARGLEHAAAARVGAAAGAPRRAARSLPQRRDILQPPDARGRSVSPAAAGFLRLAAAAGGLPTTRAPLIQAWQ